MAGGGVRGGYALSAYLKRLKLRHAYKLSKLQPQIEATCQVLGFLAALGSLAV